jgi:hypothetical protein
MMVQKIYQCDSCNRTDNGYCILHVTLTGSAKLAQGNTEGYYTLNSTKNGKQVWIQVQGSNAIWYNKEQKYWMIGHKSNLEIGIGDWNSGCFLHSMFDTKTPEEAFTWNYYINDDEEWMSTGNIFGSLGMYQIFQNTSRQFLI